jgi:hypothetical protein
MKRVECKGMVGKYPNPKGKGMIAFYDTGVSIPPEDVAEAITLQHLAFFATTAAARQQAMEKVVEFTKAMAKKVNVYPKGMAALAEDGRILVTEPYFESKEASLL